MHPSTWSWGTWDEPFVLGSGELKSVAIANAIILGIAIFRYYVRPWWAKRRAALEGQETVDAGQRP